MSDCYPMEPCRRYLFSLKANNNVYCWLIKVTMSLVLTLPNRLQAHHHQAYSCQRRFQQAQKVPRFCPALQFCPTQFCSLTSVIMPRMSVTAGQDQSRPTDTKTSHAPDEGCEHTGNTRPRSESPTSPNCTLTVSVIT